MKCNSTTKEGVYTIAILTNDQNAAKASKLLKLHHSATRKLTKFPQIWKNITVFSKKFDHPGRIFSKKHYFLTYFVQFLERNAGIPVWFWATLGFQKNTLFWKIPYYIAVKFDHIGRIFARYSVVFLKKGSFLEKRETIWWVSLKPPKVSFFFFFREILRFLRNFGGFIAKMRSKMTKMRVSKVSFNFFHIKIYSKPS